MGQAASRRRRAGRVRWNRRRLGSSVAKLPGDEVGENDPPGRAGEMGQAASRVIGCEATGG